MTKHTLLIGWLWVAAGTLYGQGPPKGYKTTPSGFHYKIHTKSNGKPVEVTDMVRLNLQLSTESDSVVFSTYDLPDNPIDYKVREPSFNGDIMEAFTLLRAGDSATFYLQADSLYRQFKPEFAEPGLWMRYDLKVYEVESAAEYEAKKKAEKEGKIEADLATIDSFLQQNGISAEQHGNLYIHWHKRGKGKKAEKGADITVHYNGRLLDGKKFDSSWDRKEPFMLRLGTNQVIEGWEEALLNLNQGDSVTVYIPSAIAYAERGAGQVIPPHAILVFDIEVLDIYNFESRLQQDIARIGAIVRERGVAAQQTESGVYFYRTKTGDGPRPEKGKKVSLRYTMYLQDGTIGFSTGDAPVTVTLGDGKLVDGMEEALPLFGAGTKAWLFIPSPLGYGRMASESIPSNSILEVEVEVVSVD